MANWWEEAPLAQEKTQEDNWWADAPLAEEAAPVTPARPPLEVPEAEQQYEYQRDVERPLGLTNDQPEIPGMMGGMSGTPMEYMPSPRQGPNGETIYDDTQQTYTDTETVTGNINDVLKDVVDEKGDITTNSYDNLTYDQALKVYESLANHPESVVQKNFLGQDVVVFRGHKVPFPEPKAANMINTVGGLVSGEPVGADVSDVTLMGDKIVGGISNLAQFALSGVDKLTGRNDSEMLDRPEMKPGGIGDALKGDAIPIMVGGAGGLKAANTVANAAGKATAPAVEFLSSRLPFLSGVIKGTDKVAGAVGRGGAVATGVNVGAMAPIDEDTSGIFAGEESLGPELIQTFGMDEDGKFNPDTFDKKMNLAIDSFASGVLIGVPAKVIAKVGKFAWETTGRPLASYSSKDVVEQEAAQSILNSLGLPENATREQRLAFVKKLDNIIAENENMSISTGPGTSMGPQQPNVKLDPLAAIAEGAKTTDPVLAQQARTSRNDLFGSTLPEPEIKQRSYTDDIVDPFKQELYDQGGGAAGVEAARSGIVTSAKDEIATAANASEQARTALTGATDDLGERIRTDINFGATISDLEKTSNVNILKGTNQASDDITRNVQAAEESMYTQRKKLYESIPATVKIEADEFNPLVYKIDPETGQINTEKFADGLTPAMKRIITEANGSFRTLHNQLVPELSKAIAKGGDRAALYQEIKDNLLEDQIEILTTKGGAGRAKFKDSLEKARAYNLEYMKYFGKKSPLENIKKANQDRGLIGVNEGRAQTAAVDTRRELETNVLTGNTNREKTGTLVELLKRPEAAGSDPAKIVDYRLSKTVVDKLLPKIRSDGVSNLDVTDFQTALKEDAAMLEKEFPERYSQVQKLLNDVDTAKGDIAKLQKIADDAQATLETTSKEVGAEIRPFIDQSTGLEKSEGQGIFEGIFNAKDDLTPTRRLIERAKKSGDPAVLSGIKSSFGKNLALDPEGFAANEGRVLDVAKELYADDPDILASIAEAARLLKVTEIGKGTRTGADSAGAGLQKGAAQAATRVITMMFGVLNPTATKIRTVASVLGNKYNPRESLVRVVGQMASDPDEFRRILAKHNKAPALGRNAGIFLDLARRAGIYSGQDGTSAREFIESSLMDQGNDTDKQTKDAFK